MTTVFRCRPTAEDDRPVIDFDHPENMRNDWLTIGEVLDGEAPLERFPKNVRIVVNDPQATEWDCYLDGHARGLFSQRFVDAVGPEALEFFTPMPATLNAIRYYFLRRERGIDCLDHQHSVYQVFTSEPSRIMSITHYAFREEKLPVNRLFCLPDSRRLHATREVVDRIRAAGLKGVSTDPLP